MYIFGASGHGKAIIELVEVQGRVEGVFDDDPSRHEVLGYKVTQLPDKLDLSASYFIAIGDNQVRKEVRHRLSGQVAYSTLIHPSAMVSRRSVIGAGTVLMEGAIVKVDATVGDQVIVNTGASVDHDCTVGDFVHLAPKAVLCGGAGVGEGSLVGAGAVVIPGVKIGTWCKIGAGSVVTRDVPDGGTWMGSALKE